ncbi:hypothetical protein [Streptomyces hesseae]|uniref:Uncharacterized protein n=1 Tax=Streptomyces hesseae TaxID=3075519 RepID=A0ABU2SH67_9ACTN|nr:hypothetical protein [Streptomyces sp. DSM 40473]MDT0447724.1 hypothetical protein [Streptomyces sp. DSM 40473]
MIGSLDHALAKARLEPRPYTIADTDQAEARLRARLAERMWHGALYFDDQMEPARAAAVRAAERNSLPHRAFRRRLRSLCETVVAQDLHKLGAFLAHRMLEPDGALVLGCVLQLADREDSARFWWQFAAGADAAGAACCLYLHHMAFGERREAELWRRQAGLEALIPQTPEDIDRGDLNAALQLLDSLRGGECFSPAASAVIAYVPDALGFVEEVDLPLPQPDFPERIGELTATA